MDNPRINKPRIRLAKPSFLGMRYGKTWLCSLPKGRLGLGDTPIEAYASWLRLTNPKEFWND